MSNPMRTAVLAGLLAAAGAVPAAAQEAAAEPEPDLAATGTSDSDSKLKIIDAKLKVEEIKARVAAQLGNAKSDEERDVYKDILNGLNRIFSILEDMLQNE